MQAARNVQRNPDRSIVVETKGVSTDSTLIWMHGLGDSAEGFVDLFEDESSPVGPNTKVVLLTAPQAPVSVNGGMVMNSWYDIQLSSQTGSSSNFGDVIKNSVNVRKVVEEEAAKLGNRMDRVMIGGFSQGAVMALYNGLHFGEKIGGIISLSGYLLPDVEIPDKHSNILLVHGQIDQVIPIGKTRESYNRLGFVDRPNVQYHSIPNMPHTVNMQVISLMTAFVKKCLK